MPQPASGRVRGADLELNHASTKSLDSVLPKGGWAAQRSIVAYGIRVGIRTNQPDLLDRLSDYLPPVWRSTSITRVERLYSLKIGGPRGFHQMFEDSEFITKSRSLNEVLEDFERRLKLFVAEKARRRVFVHAGAVGWQGRAILIPGLSHSGKTSLVVELVRAGATYYSDEYAVLDRQGCVYPYPQALGLRQPGSLRQEKCPVEEIGGVVGTRPLPVGLVLACPYKAGARWRPLELSPAQAILELLANTMPARRKPEVVMPTLRNAVATAIILKGVRGEAAAFARRILDRFRPVVSPGCDFCS